MREDVCFAVGALLGVARGRANRCPECREDNWLGIAGGTWLCAACGHGEPVAGAGTVQMPSDSGLRAAILRDMEDMCVAALAAEIRRVSSSREPLGTDGAEGMDEFGEAG